MVVIELKLNHPSIKKLFSDNVKACLQRYQISKVRILAEEIGENIIDKYRIQKKHLANAILQRLSNVIPQTERQVLESIPTDILAGEEIDISLKECKEIVGAV